MEPLIEPSDLASTIGVPERTLAQWRYQRTGPRFVKVGRHVRYRSTDIEKWLDAMAHGGNQ